MSTIHFAIATIPIAVYFMMIGALRLRTKPMITTGWRDTLTLGIAASGFVAVGPMQLFFPVQAAARWQGWVWVALLALYLLGLAMILLSCKPRLIAYGLNESQFRRTLLAAAQSVDSQSGWQADVLNLPTSGIQLANEPSGTARVHQVVHVGTLDNLQDWLKIERSFVRLAREEKCPPSAAGWPFVIGGTLLLITALMPMLADPGEALAGLRKFLNR